MGLFDLNIDPIIVEQLPPDKRYPTTIELHKALMKGLQWAHDLLFGSYYIGSSAPEYSAGSYNYLDQVIYNKQVYSSLIGSNTDAPTVAASWELIQDNFIGVKERILYCGTKLVLEYALNKEFRTSFRQPPATSDIYLTNLPATKTGFLVGETEPYCSSVGQTTSSDPIGPGIPFTYLHNFEIHIPSALATALGATYQQTISNFVRLYIPASLNFLIVTY